jgi:hypothetical protein
MPETSPSRPAGIVVFLLPLLALILGGLFAGGHVATWTRRLRYPGEESFVEGVALQEMLHLSQGERIYAPPSRQRFDAANYGPLYYLLGARLVDPGRPAYLPLRLFSLLATLAAAAGCALLAWWLGRSPFAAALAPLIFLAFGFVTRYATTVRCDVPALALMFAAFLVAYRFQNSRALLGAVPLVLLGFFFKPQFVAAPLAVLLFLLLRKRYRLAAEFAGLAAFGGLACLGLFQFVVFRGQAFLAHFFLYNLLPALWTEFLQGAEFFALALVIPVLLASEFLRLYPNALVGCYLGCAVTLGLLTVARAGSDTSYFLDSALIVSPLMAALLARTFAQPGRGTELLVLLGISFFLTVFSTPYPPSPEDFERDRAVQQYLRRNFAPGTEALGLYTGDLLRAGLDSPVSNLYHYTWLVRQGKLPEQTLLDQLSQRRFGVIVLNFDLPRDREPYRTEFYLTAPMRAAILRNYQLRASLEMPEPGKHDRRDRFYVWVPSPAASASSPAPSKP